MIENRVAMEGAAGDLRDVKRGERGGPVHPDGGWAETGKQRGMVGRRACGQGCITGADYWSLVVRCMEDTVTVRMVGRLSVSSVVMTRNKMRPA